MTDITDRPEQVILLGEAKLDHGAAKPKVTMQKTYTPPLDGTPDDFKEADQWLARQVAELLVKNYYGYSWHVKADIKQGIVAFNIPELMGETLHMIINLGQYSDLTPHLVVRQAGELLERMNLPRKPIDIALYYEALKRKQTFEFGDSLKRKAS